MMKKKLHVSTSPLTNTIFAGTLLKDGKTWAADKQDVTVDALVAVAMHAYRFKAKTGEDVILHGDGQRPIRISVSIDE